MHFNRNSINSDLLGNLCSLLLVSWNVEEDDFPLSRRPYHDKCYMQPSVKHKPPVFIILLFPYLECGVVAILKTLLIIIITIIIIIIIIIIISSAFSHFFLSLLFSVFIIIIFVITRIFHLTISIECLWRTEPVQEEDKDEHSQSIQDCE